MAHPLVGASVDDKQLHLALDSLAQELQTPFVERMRGTKHYGKDAVAQLGDAIGELSARERELGAAIGIARMLLAKNKELAEEALNAASDKSHLEGVIALLRQEQRVMQGHAVELEAKCSLLEAELATAEVQLSEAQASVMRLEELNSAIVQPEREEKTDESEELASHSRLIDKMNKSIQALERDNSGLRLKCADTEKTLVAEIEKGRQSEEEWGKCREKLRTLKEEKQHLSKRTHQAEDHAKYLEFDLMVIQRKVERLEEEAKFSLTPSTSDSGNKHERHTSLFTKLHGIEEGEELEQRSDEEASGQASWRREMSVDFGNESMEDEDLFSGRRDLFTLGTHRPFVFPELSICRISPPISLGTPIPRNIPRLSTTLIVNLPCKRSQRKDPSEEYFLLVLPTQATQAVKFSSPYMDSVCTVSAKSLYEQALRDAVPFHKVGSRQWHAWIEDQLTRAYVSDLYSADRRGRK